MNFIESLGGYRNARERCKRENVLTDEDFEYGQNQLLRYRRENNIFEVGDCYVYLNEWDDDLNNIFKFDELEWGDYLWNIERMIRHATPSEIKAGHRL